MSVPAWQCWNLNQISRLEAILGHREQLCPAELLWFHQTVSERSFNALVSCESQICISWLQNIQHRWKPELYLNAAKCWINSCPCKFRRWRERGKLGNKGGNFSITLQWEKLQTTLWCIPLRRETNFVLTEEQGAQILPMKQMYLQVNYIASVSGNKHNIVLIRVWFVIIPVV